MHTKKRFETDLWLPLRLTARHALTFVTLLVGFAVLPMGQIRLASAQEAARDTFASAAEAIRALFVAVQDNDEQAITRILGGDEEIASSGDEMEDKRDRERFVQKYQQMHRLVREPDGTTVLYVGAENWPFPVPLVTRQGQWFFDPDAGAQEVLYRRIGENESIAIGTCHALVGTRENDQKNEETDSAVSEYARRLVSTSPTNGGAGSADDGDTSRPFHGYYFRKLNGSYKRSNAPNSAAGEVSYMAYPEEYRSSGVMTYTVTSEGAVYEKDLGPNTEALANAITASNPDSSWHAAD